MCVFLRFEVKVKGASLDDHLALCETLVKELIGGKPLQDVKVLAGLMRTELVERVLAESEQPGQ